MAVVHLPKGVLFSAKPLENVSFRLNPDWVASFPEKMTHTRGQCPSLRGQAGRNEVQSDPTCGGWLYTRTK